MKHLKKHPINDKAQKLSKDMKKQDLVKPKTDKKLDADDSLSDPKISKKYTKPSNKKLDGETFLSADAGKIKKTNEEIGNPHYPNPYKKTETISLTKEELMTFMEDIDHGNWSDTSYRICEFLDIDPTEGT